MGIIHANWALWHSLPGRERAGKQAFLGHLFTCMCPTTVMLLTLWVGTIILIIQMTWREDQWFILKNQLSKEKRYQVNFLCKRMFKSESRPRNTDLCCYCEHIIFGSITMLIKLESKRKPVYPSPITGSMRSHFPTPPAFCLHPTASSLGCFHL